jgi:hypothetical protein
MSIKGYLLYTNADYGVWILVKIAPWIHATSQFVIDSNVWS